MFFSTLRQHLCVCLVAVSTACAMGNEPPNVLLISIDDLNDWVGCLGGNTQTHTPNIDRLAERGVLFSNAHCQAPHMQSVTHQFDAWATPQYDWDLCEPAMVSFDQA